MAMIHTMSPFTKRPQTALLLAGLLLAAQPFLPPAVQAAHAAKRTLHISAVGEVTARPDMATVLLGTETQAKTAREALTANTRAMQEIFDLLKTKWRIAERDMMTDDFTISPVYESYKRPDGSHGRRVVGYRVRNMLTIRVRRLDDLGGLLDSVVTAGSNRIHDIRFTVSDPEKLKEEALRRAVRKALAKARIMAEEAGFSLGPIITMRESSREYVPPIRIYHRSAMAKAASAPVPMASGEAKVSVTVNITWEIR